MTQTLTTIFSILTVIADVIVVLAILTWIIRRFTKLSFVDPIIEWVQNYYLELLLIPPLLATLGSLYYSEIAGWAPCRLCWFQRIFMYPQVLLVLIAMYYKTKDVVQYLLPLTFIGMLISLRHYIEQIQAKLAPLDPLAPCDLTGISCAKTYTFHFGYITLPMMAFSAFALVMVILVIIRSKKS